MPTIRTELETFIYEHIEYFVDLIAREGEEATFQGIKVLDEPERFVHGALVNATAALYVHYVETNDSRAEETFENLRKFIEYAIVDKCRTWGKLGVLRGLNRLHQIGALEKLDKDSLKILEEKTRYTDFYSKEKGELINHASNYMQVAMACAGFREKIGWDTGNFSDTIKEQFLKILETSSTDGWMDEQPPYGRFDRYSLLVASETYDNFEVLEKSISSSIKKNLKDSAEIILFMANRHGDGINYGRSLSTHGDSAALEILSSAAACGLLNKEQSEQAVAYSIHIIEKLIHFWYDKERKSFNIWWDGRNTNKYRGVARVLEVNLDMAMHLLTALQNFEQAGLADYEPKCKIEASKTWETREINFIDKKEQMAKTILLKRNDTMIMLPLIGLGNWYTRQAYMPYPSICKCIEGSPEGNLPFMIPEYVLEDDTVVRPIQYYESIETIKKQDDIKVIAKGKLCIMKDNLPKKSNYEFTSIYHFHGNEITSSFSINCDYKSCRMLVATHDENTKIDVSGFEHIESLSVEDAYEFHTPHGAFVEARMYCSENGQDVGYQINLKDLKENNNIVSLFFKFFKQ